jgi:hypothetical protein
MSAGHRCPRQDSNLRTRLRRPVPNAHPDFPRTLQSQVHCLQPPLLALVDGSSFHEPLHDDWQRLDGEVEGVNAERGCKGRKGITRRAGAGLLCPPGRQLLTVQSCNTWAVECTRRCSLRVSRLGGLVRPH